MIPFIIIAVVAVLVLAKAIIIIPATKRYVITRLGRFLRIAGPGMVVVIPMIDTVTARYDLDAQERRFSHESTEVVVRYRILDPRKAFEGIADVHDAVEQSARTAIKAVAEGRSGRALTDTFTRQAIVRKINEIVENFGVQVTDVELTAK